MLTGVPALIHDYASCSLSEIWFEKEGPSVYLNLNRVATEEDLENDHYLGHEWQTIETVCLQVAFCPYCGEKLCSDTELVVPQFLGF